MKDKVAKSRTHGGPLCAPVNTTLPLHMYTATSGALVDELSHKYNSSIKRESLMAGPP